MNEGLGYSTETYKSYSLIGSSVLSMVISGSAFGSLPVANDVPTPESVKCGLTSEELSGLKYFGGYKYLGAVGAESNTCYKDFLPLHSRLASIQELRLGWGGEGSEAFDSEVIRKANSFLGRVQSIGSQLYIFPTFQNSIQFEWQIGDVYAEVEVFSDHLEFYAERNGEEFDSIDSVDEKLIGGHFVGLFSESRG